MPCRSALAVHDEDLFELDGNTANDPAVLGDDWSNFQSAGNAVSTVFVADGVSGVNDTTFHGGGSQPGDDIPTWAWDCSSPPSKADIAHVFASAYVKSGKLFLYFGADRFEPTSGTTNLGFWFLQGGGALTGGTGCPDATAPEGGAFTGAHVDGDLYVFAGFNGGGGDSEVSVLEWRNGALNPSSRSRRRRSVTPLPHRSPPTSTCATTNNTTFTPPWPYTASGGGTTYAVGAFYEGGIDLSGLYQALNKPLPCVSQFLAVMGSSSATTGTNKDFAGGGFNLCSKILIDKETVPAGDPASSTSRSRAARTASMFRSTG